MMAKKSTSKQFYDVALSFSGKDRKFVQDVAEQLKFFGISVFYDIWDQPNLLGRDLFVHLADIYQNSAKYCLIFISKSYVESVWPQHELKFASARSLSQEEPYIIPVRLDSSVCPGIPVTIAHIDAKKMTPLAIALLIQKKLGARLKESLSGYFILSKRMTYTFDKNGAMKAIGLIHLVWLGKGSRDYYNAGIWSPNNTSLNLVEFEASDKVGELVAYADTDTESQKTFKVRFRKPLAYGDSIELKTKFRCQNYVGNIFKPCSDFFRIGVPTQNWDYSFRFPKGSKFKYFHVLIENNHEVVNESVRTVVKNGSPVARIIHTEPPTGSVFRIQFELVDIQNDC